MSARPAHFTQTGSDAYLPTSSAQSHWGDDHLNGPALVGLAARELEEHYGLDEFMPARITVELFKAARSVETIVSTRLVRDARRVRNSECELIQNGVAVARATLAQYRRSAAPRGEEWSATMEFAPPSDVDDARYTFMRTDDTGWTHSIAPHQNASRKRVFNRTVDVVAGTPNTPFANAVMAAEATSLVTNLGTAGIGYINGDLTVALARLPLDEWIGVQADSHWTADGVGVGTATLFDHAGAFGTGMVTAISNPKAQIDFAND